MKAWEFSKMRTNCVGHAVWRTQVPDFRAKNSQTTTSAGDIVLYNGNNIVMFYGSNSWSYTRIGKIDDLSDWEKALGSGSITAVFTLVE